MKTIIQNRILQLCYIFVALLFAACEEGDTNPPRITEIRNYADSPNDTLITTLVPGQWVVITGKNLSDAIGIAFNGIPADFNAALFSDTYAIVQVPSVIPFPSLPEDDLNTIEYATASGSTIFEFPIVAGPPTLTGVLNENPVAGERVVIFGTNLFLTSELVFAGTVITDFTEVDNGTSISFVMPDVSTSGPVSVTTASGSVSSFFSMNNYATDVLCNFDNISPVGWGGWGTTIGEDPEEFPNNNGKYGVLNVGILNPWDWGTWNYDRMIRTDALEWMPVDNLIDPVGSWAVKFEINVPGKWNKGTTLFVTSENNDYRASFRPWRVSETATADFTTEGNWVTVTIPLSQFHTGWNIDDANAQFATSISQLLNPEGKAEFAIYTMNVSDGPSTTALYAAIDNMRIVKIH